MSQMTKWYPPHIKPLRQGIYEIKYKGHRMKNTMYATWNGERWSVASESTSDGYHTRFMYAEQQKYWRGFKEEQK